MYPKCSIDIQLEIINSYWELKYKCCKICGMEVTAGTL